MTALQNLAKHANSVDEVCTRLNDEAARMRRDYYDWIDKKLGEIFATIREAAGIAVKFGAADEGISISKIFKVSLYSNRIWVIEQYQDFDTGYKDSKTGYYKRWHMMDIEKDRGIKNLIGYDLIHFWDQKDFEKQVKKQINGLMNKRMKKATENYDSAKEEYERITM